MKNLLPRDQPTVEEPTLVLEEAAVPEEPPSQPSVNRKKRSQLPLNLDDYEKRRSVRSVRPTSFVALRTSNTIPFQLNRTVTDDTSISAIDKFRRLLSNDGDDDGNR